MTEATETLSKVLQILKDEPDSYEVTAQWHNPATMERTCLTVGHLRELAGRIKSLQAALENECENKYRLVAENMDLHAELLEVERKRLRLETLIQSTDF